MPSIADSLQLTRSDMAGFPEESVKFVLDLQKNKGWRATRSNRSHLALLSPDGQMRFGLSSAPGGLNWLKRDVKRYYQSKGEEEPVPEKKKVVEKFPCPRNDCNKTYASLEQLNVHTGVDHEGLIVCADPSCNELFKKPAGMALHRSQKHGYQSPTYEKRKKQEANRAAKRKAEPEAVIQAAEESSGEAGRKVGRLIGAILTADREAKLSTVNETINESVSTKISPIPELTPEERARLDHLDSEEVFERQNEEVEDLDYIDDRNSWVLDMSHLLKYSVKDVFKMMTSAGLGMEIRVWKEE